MSSIHAAIAAQNLAVITGAGSASGIGLAAAIALYKQEMNIAIGDVTNNLDEAVGKIKASNSKTDSKVWRGSVDVSQVKSVEEFRSKVHE